MHNNQKLFELPQLHQTLLPIIASQNTDWAIHLASSANTHSSVAEVAGAEKDYLLTDETVYFYGCLYMSLCATSAQVYESNRRGLATNLR